MSTIAIPPPPNPDESTRLARFIRELTEIERAHFRPRTVTVWDEDQGIYRSVDPKDTKDFLHLAAQEVDRLRHLSSTHPNADAKHDGIATPAGNCIRRMWAKIRSWLPGITTSHADARRHIAECYLAAARKAAAEGRHIEAQGLARSCLLVLKA